MATLSCVREGKIFRSRIHVATDWWMEIAFEPGEPYSTAGTSEFKESAALVDAVVGFTAATVAISAVERAQSTELVSGPVGRTSDGASDARKARAREIEDTRSEFRRRALFIAGLIPNQSSVSRRGWCSGCLDYAVHWQISAKLPTRTYLCQSCGAPSTICFARDCTNFANKTDGVLRLPSFCAEHSHAIPSFDRATSRLADLSEAARWLTFDKRNLRAVTQVLSLSLAAGALLAPIAFAAAPAIGGALGSLTGLSGAAATSHGLALLGGGTIASGGAGMAGGIAVVTASGALLGGSLGAAATTAYVQDDASFKIEKLRYGTGVPVVVASGFLSDKVDGWREWQRLVDSQYLNSPVYRVHWGAKELNALGRFLGAEAGKHTFRIAAQSMAKHATKTGAKTLGWIGYPILLTSVATNPWTVAKKRADMTGAVLADLLARTDADRFVLIGHSLGARVMAVAAQTLGTVAGRRRIGTIHLLGAAVDRDRDWRALDESAQGTVFNYFSTNDSILGTIYRVAELGKKAAGSAGFGPGLRSVKDINVSANVAGHSSYFRAISLCPDRPSD